jgi:hypothetical protein
MANERYLTYISESAIHHILPARRLYSETEVDPPGPPSRPWLGHWAVKIDFGIMPWMPLVPSTAWVT